VVKCCGGCPALRLIDMPAWVQVWESVRIRCFTVAGVSWVMVGMLQQGVVKEVGSGLLLTVT
jgi:hypothetical protein